MLNGIALTNAFLTIVNIIGQRNFDYERIFSQRIRFDEEYDFIIVGGGAGGATVAGRLAESNAKILLLERGGVPNLISDIPAMEFLNLIPPNDHTIEYYTEFQEHGMFGFENHSINLMGLIILGGGTTLNGLIYNRGGPDDFNGWKLDYGCDGWGFDDVLPFFKMSEDQRDDELLNGPSADYHGVGGPLTVESINVSESIPTYALLNQMTFDAALELGYKVVDFNGPNPIGITSLSRTRRNGHRLTAVEAFLLPPRPNLDIMTHAMATRILMYGKRAVGVEFINNGMFKRIFARKEIILSCGSIETAKLLMLSGIGPREHLEDIGIEVVADLKVGFNYQDHTRGTGVDFTVNTSLWIDWENLLSVQNLAQFYGEGRGPLANTHYLVPAGNLNIRTNVDPKGETFGPSDVMLSVFLSWPGVNGLVLSSKVFLDERIVSGYYLPNAHQHQLNMFMVLKYAKSRGRLMLASNNYEDQPLINPKYLSDRDDVDRLIEAYKILVQLGSTEAWISLGATRYAQPIPTCSQHEFDSDPYIECVVRTMVSSEQHASGTCKMGPAGDPTAVVDTRLRVQGGITGLRVVDASIQPQIVTGNPMAVSYMIGERGADFIKQEHGLYNDKNYYYN